jgi:hypothetical protein
MSSIRDPRGVLNLLEISKLRVKKFHYLVAFPRRICNEL